MFKKTALLTAVAGLSLAGTASAALVQVDLGTSGGSAAGWDVFAGGSVTDAAVTDQNSVDNDVTLSIGAIGGVGNVPGVAGGTPIDGITVPSEAWDDYFYGPAPFTGTEILFEFKNLDAGDYDVSVFMGRNNTEHGRIWVGTLGDDPGVGGSGDTGDFGFGSQTLAVTVGGGDSLFFVLEEDNTGGISGIIVNPVPEPGSLALLGLGGLCILRRRRG